MHVLTDRNIGVLNTPLPDTPYKLAPKSASSAWAVQKGSMERGDKMDRYEKAKRLNDTDFKQITGVTKETFEAMAGNTGQSLCRKAQTLR
jgi:hypothetical protein